MSDLLVSYYGDDFSGSADVMEVLSSAGLRTILFLSPPTAAQLKRFPEARAVGVAGISRSLPVAQLEQELRPAFERLRHVAPFFHYKICSTFDSSPEIGSIGRSIDVGRQVFQPDYVPVVVGAPALGRYCLFGNLFASSGTGAPVSRLDRHPTMSCHPATPMDEADLIRVLGRQTNAKVGLVDWRALEGEAEGELDRIRSAGAEVVLFDTATERHLQAIGRLLWQQISSGTRSFAVGSSGIEYALVSYWRKSRVVATSRPSGAIAPADRLLVVSGSCSPVTAGQIGAALEAGFREVRLDPQDWVRGEFGRAVDDALGELRAGRSVIVHSAAGPDDPRLQAATSVLQSSSTLEQRNPLLSKCLSAICRAAIEIGVRRIAIAGGDTSGHVTRELRVEALEWIGPIAPGSPLCRVVDGPAALEGLEMTFKGGQVGRPDFFVRTLRGSEQA